MRRRMDGPCDSRESKMAVAGLRNFDGEKENNTACRVRGVENALAADTATSHELLKLALHPNLSRVPERHAIFSPIISLSTPCY